ncbi:MAG: N-6 DNA methylase [Candidatus Margulisiibacteriota bacterium]
MTTDGKRHIDAARQVLVGVVPNPTSQIDQITNALIYKFMDDMDQAATKAGGKASFFAGDLARYAWTRLMDSRLGNQERMNLYVEALAKFSESKKLPDLFREIFKAAFLPYRSPEVLGLFLKEINYFDYSHPEELGNAYEYLLSIMSSQGDAGQFRTPRHIIDFIVDVVNPTKEDKVLDPACGTGGFLVKSYLHILEQHDGKNPNGAKNKEMPLTPDEKKKLMNNIEGYDVDPGMVRIAQVNMYLHQFKSPRIYNYNTLSNDERWGDKFDVMLANPPFMSPKGGVRPHNKFSVQSNRSEVLFVDYIMSHLRPKGRAGIIVPEGIIFQSGIAYKQLRKNLIEDGLYAVVSLPSGVFSPYSGVKTSVLFFDNEIVKQYQQLLFVDIRDIGYSLGAMQAPIERDDLKPAISIIKQFRESGEIEPSKLAFTTDKDEIINAGYDLSLSKYRKRIQTNGEISFVLLSDVANISKGKSSSTKTAPGLYPLVLTAEEDKTADHYDFDGEGVCVPLISATGHGKAAIKRVHYVKGKFSLANLLAFVEPKDMNVLDPKYLYHCLDTSKDEMAKLMKGAANVSMKVEDLERYKIPLPPLEAQKQIVEELDGYQNIISGAWKVVESWKPRIDIDPGWERVKLGDVCKTTSGGTPLKSKSEYYENGTIPWLRSGEVAQGFVKESELFITEEGLKNSSAKIFPVNTVLVAMYGATAGQVGLLKFESSTNQAICGILPNSKYIPEFLYQALKDQKDLMVKLSGGGAQPNISQSIIRGLEIPIPPLETQKAIVGKIETERALVEANKKLIEIYEKKMKDAISKLWDE